MSNAIKNDEEIGNYVEHIVEVDEYIEIRLKIPKRLSAIALKGLMLKADKLFKLSENQIQTTKVSEKTTSPSKKKNQGFWTKEKERILRSKYGKVPTQKIAKEIGAKNTQQLHHKIHYMRKQHKW